MEITYSIFLLAIGLVALLLREDLVLLEDIWPHICKEKTDPISEILDL